MVLETHMKLCVAEPDFSGGNFLPKKMGKWTKNGTKTGFFEFIEKFGNQFLLNMLYNENLYILCCVPSQIPYLGKFSFLRYEPKCS